MKIGLHGSYYSRNFGDTLILHIVKSWLKEHSDSVEVSLPFVTSEKEAFEILGNANPKISISDLDGLIFGPGGYFGEPPVDFVRKMRWTLRNYDRHLKWNSQLYKNNVPYAIVGVGVGPISSKWMRKKITSLFQRANYISVRDKYSKQYLIEWGIDGQRINVVSDVALTLSPKLSSNKGKKKVVLHIPGKRFLNSEKQIELIEFVKFLIKDNELFLLEDEVNQFSNRKGTIYDVFIENNIPIEVIRYKTPETLIDKLGEMDNIITTKLHVGIVGYALGKNVLSIPLHTKTLRFYEQINRENFCIPFDIVNSNLLIGKYKELDSISDSTNIQYDNAILNKNIIFKFLDEISREDL